MNKKKLAAKAVAIATVLWAGAPASAGDIGLQHPFDDDLFFAVSSSEDVDRFKDGSSWTFGPMANLRLAGGALGDNIDGNRSELTEFGHRSETLIGSLGFRSLAKVDSRLGAIYSRLSLSFEHALEVNDHLVVAGLSGGASNGYYAEFTQVDVMALDAQFAMKMSDSVTGLFAYGAKTDLGSGAEHQILLRIKFGF